MASFGALLLQHRLDRSWKQSTLADHAGYDASYVSRLEHGQQPTKHAVGKFADALKLEGEARLQLYIAAGFIPPEMPQLLADCDPAVIALHELLEQLPDHAASEFSHAIRMLVATWQHENRVGERGAAFTPKSK